MLSSKAIVPALNTGRIAAREINPNATAATSAPTNRNGMHRPSGVCSRSDHAPMGWLDQQRSQIIQRHKKADKSRSKLKFVRKKDRDKRVKYRPKGADTEIAKTKYKDFSNTDPLGIQTGRVKHMGYGLRGGLCVQSKPPAGLRYML